MKVLKLVVMFLMTFLLVAAIICLIMSFKTTKPNYLGISTTLMTLCLVITAVNGFYSNREAIRLQTSMTFSSEIFKMVRSDRFKKMERDIQKGISVLKDKGIVCPIDDIEDDNLKKDIHKYCGYMDGIGILVMEHLINPEVFLYKAGVGTLRTYFLLEPYIEATRMHRKDHVESNLKDDKANKIISGSVGFYYAHFELLALELRRSGFHFINEIDKKLNRSRKNKKVMSFR